MLQSTSKSELYRSHCVANNAQLLNGRAGSIWNRPFWLFNFYTLWVIVYLPLVLFLTLGWFLNDPVALLATGLFIFLSLSLSIFQKSSNWLRGVGSALLFGLVLIYLISTFINGINPILAAQGMYQRNFGLFFWISLAIVFSYVSHRNLKASLFIGQSLTFLLGLGIFYGVIQRLGLDPFPWKNPYKAIQLTLGNPNFAGALFGILSIIPVYWFCNAKSWVIKSLSVGLLAANSYVAVGTKSLQALVVMVASLLAFVIIIFATKKNVVARIVQIFSGFMCLIVLIGTPVLIFVNLDFLANLRNQFFFQGSVAQRLDYWRTGIKIFMDHPLIGVGPDQFQRYAALYRTNEQVVRDGAFTIPDKAHSALIDAFANGGVLAGFLWLSFVVFVLFKLVLATKMNLTKNVRTELAALGGIWIGYLFQALISPDQLILAVIGFMAAGFIVRIGNATSKIEVKSSRFEFFFEDSLYARTVFISLLILSIAIWGQAINADKVTKQILSNANLTRDSVLSAVNQWPAPKTTELIAVEVSQTDPQCDLTEKLADRLIEVDERSAQGWYLKAICFNVNREFDKALNATIKALTYDPLNPTYLVAKAKVGIAAGKRNAAVSALEAIRENYPDNPEIAPLETSISLM